jgi:Flp pilus assembly protein TadD
MQAEMLVMRNEDTDRAIETLRELAMPARNSPAPTIRLATALRRTGRTDEALVVIERSLLHRPAEPLLTACQVDLLNRAGRFRDAVTAAGAALDAGAPEETLALPLAESFMALGSTSRRHVSRSSA